MNFKIGEYTFGRYEPSLEQNYNRMYFLPTCKNESQRTDPLQLNIENFVQEYKDKEQSYIEAIFKEKIREVIEKKISNESFKSS